MKSTEFVKISNSSVTYIVIILTVTSFLANPSSLVHLLILVPLIVSVYLMSMSAVLFNNIYDRDIDGSMPRTSFRIPIVRENISQLEFTAILSLTVGLLVAFIFINYISAIFMFFGFLSYAVLYTIFLKRKTSLNIVIGGIAGSFASISGWMAPSIEFSLQPILIALFVFAWMSLHFLVFSLVHNDEYKGTDLPMLPVKSGTRKAIQIISLNSGLVLVISSLPVLLRSGLSLLFYLLVTVLMGAILVVFTIRLNIGSISERSAEKLLNYSVLYLLIMLLSFGFTNAVMR